MYKSFAMLHEAPLLLASVELDNRLNKSTTLQVSKGKNP